MVSRGLLWFVLKQARLKTSAAVFGLVALLPSNGEAEVLRVRNRTPFILHIHVAGVRVAWIKPFHTEPITGLKNGYHQIYANSRYGSGYWGPRKIYVPGQWNLTPSAGGVAADAATALVSRIYRQNKASLVACDRLATRRGEDLQGQRVELHIAIDAEGSGVVKINGAHISSRLRSCYKAVSSQWKYPATGESYKVSFQHIHYYR